MKGFPRSDGYGSFKAVTLMSPKESHFNGCSCEWGEDDKNIDRKEGKGRGRASGRRCMCCSLRLVMDGSLTGWQPLTEEDPSLGVPLPFPGCVGHFIVCHILSPKTDPCIVPYPQTWVGEKALGLGRWLNDKSNGDLDPSLGQDLLWAFQDGALPTEVQEEVRGQEALPVAYHLECEVQGKWRWPGSPESQEALGRLHVLAALWGVPKWALAYLSSGF